MAAIAKGHNLNEILGASGTVEAIYRLYEEGRAPGQNDGSERTYLGASIIGDPCGRALWLGFRWVAPPEKFEGRIRRLFETGHREESRMLADLRAIGVNVEDRNPDGTQYGFVALGGHFRGHMDGVGYGSGFIEAPKAQHVIEAKTHNQKSFTKLVTHGVRVAHFKHFAQMQIYMKFAGIDRAFYIAHNKDTDELYTERVNYDEVEALKLVAKAERIINAPQPPSKIHLVPNARGAVDCMFCRVKDACHNGAWPRVNCRTCLSSTPVDGGWHCDFHGRLLDKAEMKVGCARHLFIPALVPAEQVDADADARTVTYRLRDGKRYVDGGERK